MELQRNLETFEREGIRVVAISPDPPALLAKFADLHGITYPLLSDGGSRVIRQFGLLNQAYQPDDEHYGLPHPGAYAVGADGRIFSKSFFASHRIREAVNNMLQETFHVQQFERGAAQAVQGPHLRAEASLASPTVRRGQWVVLTVDVQLAEGLHLYGRPLPDGYIPVTLTVDGGDVLQVERIEYPEPHGHAVDVTGENMPTYNGRLAIKAFAVGQNEDKHAQAVVRARLRYQACNDRECFPPQTLAFELPLEVLPHDWNDVTA